MVAQEARLHELIDSFFFTDVRFRHARPHASDRPPLVVRGVGGCGSPPLGTAALTARRADGVTYNLVTRKVLGTYLPVLVPTNLNLNAWTRR